MIAIKGYTRNPDGTLTRIVEDHGPSSARIPGHRGSLVVGGPGPNDRDAHRAEGRLSRDRLSWNQMHPDDRERIV